MNSRFRLALVVGSLTLAGCGDSYNAGPLKYVENERLASELKGKLPLQQAVRKALVDLYGKSPQEIKVPPGSPLSSGGILLANHAVVNGKKIHPQLKDPATQKVVDQVGGYTLYRRHCLHCHGVSGAGDGPTASFLYPRPRDYRKGLFKFTSTNTGIKPTRDDLRKTILYGLHGTSMPAFDALMSDIEIEQVVDYVIFLSMRGETELSLIDEAVASDELPEQEANSIAKSIIAKWKAADKQVMNPPVPRPDSTRESILRGRDLFLSRNKTGNKVDCTSCHGPQALGNGPVIVSQEVFNDVMFGGDPSQQPERLKKYDQKTLDLWKTSLDDWGQPVRPANLNRGLYKGGRRPIDLYWRIAKGINGAKMMAHYPTLEPERIWDLVNFVLALPYDPKLLEGATLPSAAPAKALARR